MQNSISYYLRNSIIVFLLLLSSILSGEWLSKKNPAEFAPKMVQLSGNTNSHGFYKPSIAQDKYPRISIIHAQKKDSNRIKITWDKPNDKSNKLKYAIYTSETVIENYPTFLKAKMVAFLNGMDNQYINAIKKSGTFYYAVSVISNNTEYFIPEFDQSYTSFGISMNQKPIYTVKNIKVTYDQTTKLVKIKWTLPPNSTQKYKIIRSSRPILFPTDVNSARVIAETSLNTDEYSLSADKEGSFWYAVLSISQDNRLSSKLVLSENVTKNDLTIRYPEAKLEIVKDLKARYNQANNSIEINWSQLDDNTSAVKLFLNRQESIQTKEILFNSKLLKTFLPNLKINNFTIKNPDKGNWYFAAVTYNSKSINYDLNPTKNTLLNPVVVTTKTIPLTNIPSTNTSFPTNGQFFITNRVIIYQTNEMNIYQTNEFDIMRTNIIEVPVTNFIDIPRFETNIIYITNSISSNEINLEQTITNEIFITNEVTITNFIDIEPVDQTNTIFITNTITFTNEETLTNVITITNEVNVKNRNNSITTIKQPINTNLVSENSARQLRSVIRDFYKNSSTGYFSGYYNNIKELLKIRKNTKTPAIEAQCTLFIGRAYFKLKKYNTAIKYFINIQNSLPEESNIWIRRCIRYMR